MSLLPLKDAQRSVKGFFITFAKAVDVQFTFAFLAYAECKILVSYYHFPNLLIGNIERGFQQSQDLKSAVDGLKSSMEVLLTSDNCTEDDVSQIRSKFNELQVCLSELGDYNKNAIIDIFNLEEKLRKENKALSCELLKSINTDAISYSKMICLSFKHFINSLGMLIL